MKHYSIKLYIAFDTFFFSFSRLRFAPEIGFILERAHDRCVRIYAGPKLVEASGGLQIIDQPSPPTVRALLTLSLLHL